MIQSHCEQPIEEGEDCDVMKRESEITFRAAFQNLAIKKEKRIRGDMMYSALPILCPQGFPYWLIIKPLRET